MYSFKNHYHFWKIRGPCQLYEVLIFFVVIHFPSTLPLCLSVCLSLFPCLSVFCSESLFNFWFNVIALDQLTSVQMLFASTHLNPLASWVFFFFFFSSNVIFFWKISQWLAFENKHHPFWCKLMILIKGPHNDNLKRMTLS